MVTSIYIATQAKHNFPRDSAYKPLLVGVADSGLGISLNDSSGKSISEKNKFYCELTGHYWAWKNDTESDVIGLCHYRRFLWLSKVPRRLCHRSFKSIKECDNFLAAGNVEAMLGKYDAILPRAYVFSSDNVKSQFIKHHGAGNYELAHEAIRHIAPEYQAAYEEVSGRRWVYFANLLIAKKKLFADYSAWLFSILQYIEKRIDLTDKENLRLLGFIGERLLNVFVAHNRLNAKEVPQIFIDPAGGCPQDDLHINLRYIKRRYFSGLLSAEERIRHIFD